MARMSEKAKKPVRTVHTISGSELRIEIPPSELTTVVKVVRARKHGGKTTAVTDGARTKIKRS
jgi:hypothetical protein